MAMLIPVAQQALAKYGEFYPLGGAMQADGTVAAVAGHEGDEHPSSRKVIDYLLETFRAGGKQKLYRAIGLAYDIRAVPPGETERTDAIAVRLEHESGYSVLVVFPYRITLSHEVKLAKPFASKVAPEVFR